MIRAGLIKFFLGLMLLISTNLYANVPAWKIIPGESSLTFTGIQNDSPVSGQFKQFSGEIKFDPDKLNESSIKIIVETGSVFASYQDLVDTLKTADWFNVKVFPQAIFTSTGFKKTAGNIFEAHGNLTIRDKTLPVVLIFNVIQQTATTAKIKGYTTIKRNAFGVGQGEWASTNEVKDDVKINFVVSAVKQ